MTEIKRRQINKSVAGNITYVDNPFNNGYITPSSDGLSFSIGKNNGMIPVLGYVSMGIINTPRNWQEEIFQARHFYRYDPMASTVINRMCEISITPIKNRKKKCSDKELTFFDAIAEKIEPLLDMIALEYMICGMAIPDYVKGRISGKDLDFNLGKNQYIVPTSFWVRNPENIILKRVPLSIERAVYLRIPDAEIHFIKTGGEYQDGTKDPDLYKRIAQQFPEYVRKIKDGETTIPLPDVKPIMRKLLTTQDYPQPFLVPALAGLKHKQRIKRMDYSIANKVLEMVRHVKVGSDEFPVEKDDDTVIELKEQMKSHSADTMDNIYTLFTNHTVEIDYVYPPYEALLNEDKYSEPNADILMAFGFSRLLMVGETGKSNAGQSNNTALGPVSALNDLRKAILRWIKELYKDLAKENGFKNVPEPTFLPIQTGDLSTLATFAIEAVKLGAISKDTVAKIIGSSYEEEKEQLENEDPVPTLDPALNGANNKPQGTEKPKTKKPSPKTNAPKTKSSEEEAEEEQLDEQSD